MSAAKDKEAIKDIAVNRKARHDYFVDDTYEAGIVLSGTEVKSLRAFRIHFKDAYASIQGNEAWLHSVHIEEYIPGNRYNHEPERSRKLLLHRHEIKHLFDAARLDGYTLIPLRFYFKGSHVKVEIGVCRGKKQHDQRQDIAKREAQRQIERALRR